MRTRVLIVDDTKTVRLHERTILLGRGYEVREALDGRQALEAVRTFRPHVVLMDIVMPHMDGIECCRKIKRNPELRQTKIIMVSTKSDYPRINAAFHAGCDDYITKPIHAPEILSKVSELAKMSRTQEILSLTAKNHRDQDITQTIPTGG